MKTYHIIIEGKVQGVFFRATAVKEARSFGLTGWVRNLDSGAVEVMASGPGEAIDQMLSWCRVGPARARVEEIYYEEQVYKPYDSFEQR